MYIKDKIENRIININADILTALKQMDKVSKKLLFVFDGNQFINLLSIGDIQRTIISKKPLTTSIKEILRKNTRLASTKDSVETIKAKMYEFHTECMPILDENSQLVDVYFWEDIFATEEKRIDTAIDVPVVIMAGGIGKRLKPITNVLPKPLIPIGNKTIIEEIMDRFAEAGCNNFYLSVNYKAEMIKSYFTQLNSKKYNINYFQEAKPLGTAGSLFLIKDKINTTFFISNCDIIISEVYAEILKYHREHKNELTVVSALKHYYIPYGTIETGKNGILTELKEKPELTFQINSGLYILEPHLLKEIPDNKFLHITHLIENILERKGKVGVFPVSEGSWKDIGDWNQYLANVKVN